MALSDEPVEDIGERSYSLRLIRPFLRVLHVLQSSDRIPPGVFAALEVMD